MLIPRDYQQQAIRELYAHMRAHKADESYAPLLVAPTGSGKSLLIAMIVRDVLTKWPGNRILMLTHSKELIEQNYEKLHQLMPECDAGIYSASVGRKDTHHTVLFCGIQSVYNKAHIIGRFDLIIIDEAHLIPKSGNGRYRTFFAEHQRLYNKLKVLGLTATPFRLDSGLLTEGDDALFTHIAAEIEIMPLINSGYLSRLTTKAGHINIDLSSVHTRQGDYVTAELDHAMRDNGMTQRIIADALQRAADRKAWLVFAVTIEHAHELADELNAHGIHSAVVTGETPKAEREALIAHYKAGRLHALCSVAVLTTGFDAPATDCLLICRPTQSTGLHIQILGRGMRTAPNKQDCLVLDYAGNTQRHGCIDDPNINIPKKGKGDGEAPTKTCPECESVLHARIGECPDCGHLFPPPAPKLELVASDAPIFKADMKPVTVAVSNVTYRKHQKEGKLPTLQVDYWDETGIYPIKIASEWVCVEHPFGSFPRMKANRWLKKHGLYPLLIKHHSTLGQGHFIDGYLDAKHLIYKPSAIVIDKSGKYPQVIDHIFDESEIYQAA